ncbi:MAG: succinylglutamate desuccinylase/aspartoacylase family protein [Cyanobacteria bacterium HKST-UBA02]|nr:succinylglutamate desuccinylase/aspartoacylase family protein [Cyanobacteria bacterium HKST-UBA02]
MKEEKSQDGTMETYEKEGITIHTVKGKERGEDFTVFGSVHGNEYCGSRALERILQNLRHGKIRIRAGNFTCVPIANPLAFEQKKRFVIHNLNRAFYRREDNEITCQEHRYANVLAPLLEKQGGYFLDLHSYTAQGNAFAILGGEMSDKFKAFAKSLGVSRLIYGWGEVVRDDKTHEDARMGQGTVNYARLPENGMYSITLECGHHHNPDAADIGYQATLNVLKMLDIADIDEELFEPGIMGGEQYSIKLKYVQFKTKDGEFSRDWINMDSIREGETIATYSDGEELTAPQDGFIVLPNMNATINDEWFFFGVREDF